MKCFISHHKIQTSRLSDLRFNTTAYWFLLLTWLISVAKLATAIRASPCSQYVCWLILMAKLVRQRSHHGNKPLGLFVRELLDWVTQDRNTHTECVWCLFKAGIQDCIKRRKSAEYQRPSYWFLTVDSMGPAASHSCYHDSPPWWTAPSNCETSKKNTLSLLKLLLSGIKVSATWRVTDMILNCPMCLRWAD